MILEVLTGGILMAIGTLIGASISRPRSDSPEEAVEEETVKMMTIPKQTVNWSTKEQNKEATD